jgi:uncharacterized OB-fold protein
MTTTNEYKKPLPRRTRMNSPYWDGLKAGELRLPKCNQCGWVWHPPASATCPNCLSQDDFEYVKLSGRGKIWSWVRMHQRYFEGFYDEVPYNIVYVELDERPGLRVISNLVDFTEADLRMDQPVEAVFEAVTPEWTLLKFRPVR